LAVHLGTVQVCLDGGAVDGEGDVVGNVAVHVVDVGTGYEGTSRPNLEPNVVTVLEDRPTSTTG
jgi:hypothetical protein